MEQLFKRANYTLSESHVKQASKRVSPNPAEWSKEAIEYFYDQYPQYIGSQLFIQFKEKDADKGYGVGSLRIGPFALPVLIKEHVMSPFDLAIRSDGLIVPFNSDVMDLMIAQTSPFKELDARPKDLLGIAKIDRTLAYASSVPDSYIGAKTASILERVAEMRCITLPERKRIIDVLANDENTKNAYESNEMATNVIAKLASLEVNDDENVKDALTKNIDRDLHYIYKVGNFEWQMILGSSKVDDPVRINIPEDKALIQPQFKTIPRVKTASVKGNLEKEGDLILLRDKDGLFITEDGEFTRVVGDSFKTAAVAENLEKFIATPLKGDFGILAIKDDENNYTALTEPFEVEKIAGTEMMLSITGQNKEFNVIRTQGQELWEDKEEKNTFYIPGNAVFMKLAKEFNPDEITYKNSNFGKHHIRRLTGDDFIWNSPVLHKYAERHNLEGEVRTFRQTMWALVQAGASENTLEKVATMKSTSLMMIEEDLYLPPAMSKLAEKVEEALTMPKEWEGTDHWIKLAAWMPSERSIDAVLSLNFLNKNTATEFVELLPMFEEVVHELSRLLLNVRMGLRNMDESPISEGIHALSKVILMLHGVKNSRPKK